MEILPGQRWASRSEPELGLGLVTGSDGARVRLKFPASGEKRAYAWPGAPLVRVRFAVGDQLEWQGWREGQGGGDEGVSGEGRVEEMREENGRLIYQVDGRGIPESALSGLLMRRGPLERLELGQPDTNEDFELRREALFRRAHWQKSPLRGFEGARMDLIPHQLGIAADTAERLRPRVLLADEVGLGKTIEACLILHRLHLTGRADRVLIAVPEPLVHQWFVELLRRFNLRFSIFDEERCGAIEDGPENCDVNPFTDSQLVLCGLDLLTGNAGRTDQAVRAGWNLLIVDEAHRLTAPAPGRVSGLGGTEAGSGPGSWEKESLGNQGQEEQPEDPEEITPMEAVRRLAETVPGVLLLSATPQQAGWRGHYALLHLLDPERYPAAEAFLAETAQYSATAEVIERMDATGTVDAASLPAEVRRWPEAQAAMAGEDGAVPALRAALLDRCGIGGVMFRHVRTALGGFPERAVHPVPLPDATEETRVRWLADWLRRRDAGDKVLLICRGSTVTERLREALLQEIQVKAGVFHEELTLLQRDRQAAWFAEEDGADILLCSEIGGEGRNFQFARHLVLWDLPEDPDVVEQRVGRLDRIGRRGTIHIHVPFATGTAEEAVLSWLTEGLGLLHAPVSGAQRMAEETAALRRGVLESPAFAPDRLRHLILATREAKDRISHELAAGGDRLLQWQAQTGKGQALATQLREADNLPAWEKWCIRLLESLGTQVEELRPRHWRLEAGSPESESLPEMPVEGISAVFDRAGALVREDAVFMTPDHPLPRGALDLLLGGERGTAACAVAVAVAVASERQDRPRLLLEVCYVLECVARPALHAARFLPSLPLRVVVDEKGADLSADQSLLRLQTTDTGASVLDTLLSAVRQHGLPEKAAALAAPRRDTAIAGALKKMNRVLEADLTRLAVLRQRRGLPPEEGTEIAELRARQAELREAISQARLRMDAIRVLVLKPR